MLKFFLHIVIAVAAMALSGCNNDIFFDEPDIPESQSAMIEGDGGEVYFNIPRKGLEHFGFSLMSSNEKYCTCYNSAGEVVDSDSPASKISRIVYETDFTKIELLRDGSKLTVRSICQTYQYETYWTIRLDYSYGVRNIRITVLPGRPIRLDEIAYTEPLTFNDRAKVTTDRTAFVNDDSTPSKVEILPYLNERPSVLVEADEPDKWINGERLNIPVPMYIDGEWQLTEKSGIMPGSPYFYNGPDYLTRVNVTVPPNSSGNIYSDVVYAGATAKGYMVFVNEALGRRIIEPFKVTSLYPVKYEIRIEDAK